jgi:hypothetical protein
VGLLDCLRENRKAVAAFGFKLLAESFAILYCCFYQTSPLGPVAPLKRAGLFSQLKRFAVDAVLYPPRDLGVSPARDLALP